MKRKVYETAYKYDMVKSFSKEQNEDSEDDNDQQQLDWWGKRKKEWS